MVAAGFRLRRLRCLAGGLGADVLCDDGAALHLHPDADHRLYVLEMKELMINASEMLAAVLALRDSDPDKYRRFIQDYALKYCGRWNR